MRKVVLASASPRRKALLAALGVDFEVLPSGAEEVDVGDVPHEIVVANARAKRDEAAARMEGPAVVIAADTLVFHGGHVLSKPRDFDESRAMLGRLSGDSHHVCTGVAVCDTESGQCAEGSETTEVTFRSLSAGEIDRFVEAVRPLDRAGSYTSDGPGSLLIAGYRGCYQNVLGLPIVRLDLLLREVGYSLFDEMDVARTTFL